MAESTINMCTETAQKIDEHLDEWQGVCKDVLFKKKEMMRAGRKVDARNGRRI